MPKARRANGNEEGDKEGEKDGDVAHTVASLLEEGKYPQVGLHPRTAAYLPCKDNKVWYRDWNEGVSAKVFRLGCLQGGREEQ